jgi:hypothetical protein
MTANSLTAFVRATLAAIAILTVGIPAKAQQDPTAGALAMAREILVLKGAANLYEPMVPGVIERAKLVFLGYNPLLSKDLNDVAAKLRADMGNRAAELMAESSKLYAARFSEQELKETLAFYKSPLGRKLIAEEPAIMDASVGMLRDWQNRFGEEIMIKFRQEMKKKGHDL